MNIDYADGAEQYRSALCRGLEPDPELWIDEWADEYMRIPRDTGAAEPGPYRTDRTPYAREPMRCLSPAHPAKRVVTKVASQMMKTQIALNWIGGVVHMAPSNILTLLPSLGLAKRVSGRIDKTVKASPALREKVAVSRSRDSRNTMDTKEFEGGTLYVTTAGSAANLAEVSARYVYGDEVDRWDVDVQNEGDPVELAEARGSTFGRNAKFYFSSSPTVKGASRITDLFEQGDQRHYYVPCPYCGEYQHLEWQNLKWAKDYSWAGMACCNERCSGQGAFIEEHHKAEMLAKGEWRAHAEGDGETVSFTLSALYMPLGWKSWVDLARQYDKAAAALAKGDLEPMQVFYNTRLAEVWDSAQEMTKAEELQKRAEDYRLGTVPAPAMLLTAAVDTQDDRLEMLVIGWGEGLERWIVDHKVIQGRPEDDRTWALLDEELKRRYLHASGIELSIRAAAVDSGGHHTQEVYQFCRLRRWRNIFAVKGASKTGRPVIAQRPSKVDVTWKGTTEKEGAELWLIGTDTAKDWIYNRYGLKEGPGALHFSNDLPDDFYAQCVAERKITRYVRGYRRVEWTKAKADRNEGLDLLVYNLAMAHYLSIPRYSVADWERLRTAFNQRSLFSEPADIPGPASADDDPQESPEPASKPEPKPPAPAPAAARRRTSRSGYLSRR